MSRIAAVLAALAILAAGGAVAWGSDAAVPKAPTAAVCVPKTIRVEYFSSLGGKLGEYGAPFSRVTPVYPGDPYYYKCLWVTQAGSATEAFVVFVDITPAGVPGRIASGDCAKNRPDSPPFYHSRKRYLTVSGGNRIAFQNAVGGNERILEGVLAAAEAAGVGIACPTAQPKPEPKPDPKPKPTTGQLGIDYSMPDRFGRREPNGMVHYLEGKEFDPDEWAVDLAIARKDGKPCVDGDVLAVTVDGKPLTPKRLERTRPCRARALFPKEGAYDVMVRLKTKDGPTLSGERTIVVQDWVIVGLGDSNGSGEGTPDIPSAHPGLIRWQSLRCDRSANSYQAQTARAVERRDPRTSVTFIHLACSGASIVEGLIGPYEGIVSLSPKLAPQVDAMKAFASGREIDAVVISIGINDLGFAQLVAQCLAKPDCPSSRFPENTSPTTLAQVMQERMNGLPASYAALAQALEGKGVERSRVYLTQYFDSTHDTDGSFCNPLIDTPGPYDFVQSEARYAFERILVPLNARVAAAAKKHEWRVVRGSQQRFRTHGYCSRDPWIVGLAESFANQGNQNGTLHATTYGNLKQAQLVVPKIRADFYEGGRTRRPKP